MSIRKKLIVSNILILMIPTILGLCITAFVLYNFDHKFGAENDYVLIRQLESAFMRNNKTRLESICKDLEANGYRARLIGMNGISYKSNNFDDMYNLIVADMFDAIDVNEYNFSNSLGTAVYYTFLDTAGKSIGELTLVTEKPTLVPVDEQRLVDSGIHYMRAMMKNMIICFVGIVVLTIAVLTYIISGSILKPLKLLKEGTNEIKKGNLNHSINYPKKDEFGDVCGDFEEMRLSLVALKEEEQRYEENRKELIAGITHDLNTPLTSIKGFVSGLLEGITSTPEKRTAYLQRINQTADKMSKLVEELLLYSTLDMNGVNFSFNRIDLVEYFKDCLLEIQEEFQKKEIQLHLSAECENAYANIDLMHFNRVVLNILGNSVKYKKQGNGNIFISINKDADNIILSFKDDGFGILEKELGDIFHVFYRADKSRNQSAGGNGLGLAIVQRIINAHGGSVAVNTDYSEGLEMIITLSKSTF